MPTPYVVTLLKPPYLGTFYGRDLVAVLHVKEDSPDDAIAEAQRQAFEANETPRGHPADWQALTVFEGYEENQTPPLNDGMLWMDAEDTAALLVLLRRTALHAESAARASILDGIVRKLVQGTVRESGKIECPVTYAEIRAMCEVVSNEEYGVDSFKDPVIQRIWLNLHGAVFLHPSWRL